MTSAGEPVGYLEKHLWINTLKLDDYGHLFRTGVSTLDAMYEANMVRAKF